MPTIGIFALRIGLKRTGASFVKLNDILNQIGTVFFLAESVENQMIRDGARNLAQRLYQGFFIILDWKTFHEVTISTDGTCRLCSGEPIEIHDKLFDPLKNCNIVLVDSILSVDAQTNFTVSTGQIMKNFFSEIGIRVG